MTEPIPIKEEYKPSFEDVLRQFLRYVRATTDLLTAGITNGCCELDDDTVNEVALRLYEETVKVQGQFDRWHHSQGGAS